MFHGTRYQFRALPVVQLQRCRQQRAQRSFCRPLAQRDSRRSQFRHADRLQVAHHLGIRPKAAHHPVRLQRHRHFRLVVAVTVVAVRCVGRDTVRLLAGEPLRGLRKRRMGLDRQRLRHGQHLEQKRQRRTESTRSRAQRLGGAIRHQPAQADLPPGHRH